MFNANSEASDKFRQESELAFELLSSQVSQQITRGGFEFIYTRKIGFAVVEAFIFAVMGFLTRDWSFGSNSLGWTRKISFLFLRQL